ncbi:double-stranded RNA-binding protein 4-like isoform X2 [Lotus japonicus]|nr:double-stranded RNA-binding protein 4-like isoform X2 [Lotus japonicus]
MHKNQLQEHVQKCGWPLPVYEIHNEGFAHAPKFRSTLWVNGKEYKSRLTYPHKKDAEQDAAELALKSLVSNENKKNEEHCKILPDLMQSKSVLYEYAVKMNLKSPQYRTTQQGQLHPVYVSTLLFNGESYPGKVGKSKKEAEQLVAFVAIESLLESSSCGYLHRIIKSKVRMQEGSSKPVIDIPPPSANISGLDSTVNKRKLGTVNPGSKKLKREDGWHILNTKEQRTK